MAHGPNEEAQAPSTRSFNRSFAAQGLPAAPVRPTRSAMLWSQGVGGRILELPWRGVTVLARLVRSRPAAS
jgi:hypothetical protein